MLLKRGGESFVQHAEILILSFRKLGNREVILFRVKDTPKEEKAFEVGAIRRIEGDGVNEYNSNGNS